MNKKRREKEIVSVSIHLDYDKIKQYIYIYREESLFEKKAIFKCCSSLLSFDDLSLSLFLEAFSSHSH